MLPTTEAWRDAAAALNGLDDAAIGRALDAAAGCLRDPRGACEVGPACAALAFVLRQLAYSGVGSGAEAEAALDASREDVRLGARVRGAVAERWARDGRSLQQALRQQCVDDLCGGAAAQYLDVRCGVRVAGGASGGSAGAGHEPVATVVLPGGYGAVLRGGDVRTLFAAVDSAQRAVDGLMKS